MTNKILWGLLKIPLLIGLAFIGSLPASVAQASDPFIFVGWDSEPFYYKNNKQKIQGAFFDIISEVCRIETLQCKYEIHGFRESMELLKTGAAQGGGPYIYTYPRSTILNFSKQMFSSTYGFFAHHKTAAKIKSYEDLKNLKVGVMSLSGSRISIEAVNEFVDGQMKIIEEKNLAAIMRNLEAKKYPLGYVNRDMALSWIAKNRSSLTEIPELGEDLDYRFAFSKKGLSPQALKRIQDTLDKLQQSAFINQVAQKYKLQLSNRK